MLFLGAFTTIASTEVVGPYASLYATIHLMAGSIETLLKVYMLYLINYLIEPMN